MSSTIGRSKSFGVFMLMVSVEFVGIDQSGQQKGLVEQLLKNKLF